MCQLQSSGCNEQKPKIAHIRFRLGCSDILKNVLHHSIMGKEDSAGIFAERKCIYMRTNNSCKKGWELYGNLKEIVDTHRRLFWDKNIHQRSYDQYAAVYRTYMSIYLNHLRLVIVLLSTAYHSLWITIPNIKITYNKWW